MTWKGRNKIRQISWFKNTSGRGIPRDVDGEYVTIDRSTIDAIKRREEGKATKVINLIKAIEKTAEKKIIPHS